MSYLPKKKKLKTTDCGSCQQIISKNDFNKISMARIARESGVAKGTLFNYFKTKESIFMYLLLSGYQDYLKDVLLRFQAAENITTWAAFSSFY
ncbi:TetR/AcrR family transcriptional regulator [Lactobacillus sp. R2/2]|nr:TetR/AcrR family transcriptional regulator [Lactobacillus sp. R2/2]